MRRSYVSATATLSITLFLATACAAVAGEPARAPAGSELPPEASAAAAPEVHLNLIDKKLALSLAVDMQAQIEMAEFALKSIGNDGLRRFVTARLEDQRKFADELNTLTDGRAASMLAQARREIEQDRAPDRVPEKKFRLLSVRNATAMLARIRVEILQEVAALQCGELAAKSADQFDVHYLRYDLLNQMQTLATLGVFEQQASADFAQLIHRAWTRQQAHYVSAGQLLRQLETAPLAAVVPVPNELVETVTQP